MLHEQVLQLTVRVGEMRGTENARLMQVNRHPQADAGWDCLVGNAPDICKGRGYGGQL